LFVNAFLKKIPFRNMHAVKNYNQIGWKCKTFKILEICTFRSLSVKFISETVKDRGSPWTYCRKLSIQFIPFHIHACRHYITIAVFDIKGVKTGNLKKLNPINFHPILMHFCAKCSSWWVITIHSKLGQNWKKNKNTINL
jgi:hypothetical protein